MSLRQGTFKEKSEQQLGVVAKLFKDIKGYKTHNIGKSGHIS